MCSQWCCSRLSQGAEKLHSAVRVDVAVYMMAFSLPKCASENGQTVSEDNGFFMFFLCPRFFKVFMLEIEGSIG